MSDCCRNYPGLKPRLEYVVFDSQQTRRLLVLDGVVPIQYRGKTYQIPICIWCMPHYPNEAPVPYVRPTPSMVIRERHSHVDAEGRVYLPHYISIWDPTQFTFYGVVVQMIRVFSVEPPVHARPTAMPSAEEPERRQLISVLSKRIKERLDDVNEEATNEIAALLAKKDDLIQTDKTANEEMRQKATAQRNAEDEVNSTKETLDALEKWVKSVGNARQDLEIDELLRYKDMLDEQIVDCMAQDSAYTDALDQVDEAFVHGVIDEERYMKDVRRLSRNQFYPRALRRKIERTVAGKGPSDSSGTPRRLMTTRTMNMYNSYHS